MQSQRAWRHRAEAPGAARPCRSASVMPNLAPCKRPAGLIPSLQRDAFLQALAEELEKHPVVGPGLVHRLAADLQRRFGVEAHSETGPRHLQSRQASG